MKRLFVLTALGLVSIASTASAQRVSTQRKVPEVLGISPYVGYMRFGDLMSGPLGSSIGNSTAPVLGAQLNVSVAPGISLVGNVGYSNPDLTAGALFLSDYSIGKSEVWMYDGGLQIGGGSLGRSGSLPIAPFVQLGAGAMSHKVKVLGVSTKATNFAGNVGVGADLQLIPNMSLRLMAKDYIGKFDMKQATSLDFDTNTSHNIMFSAGLKLSF
jgi:hypothetical protein